MASPRARLAAIATVLVLTIAAVAFAQADRGAGGPPAGSWTMVPHQGLGAWVDVYDWTVELGGPAPTVDAEDIEAMADAGVQTIYIQTSHHRSASDVMEPERLDELIETAHDHDVHVVAWYLPTLVDVDADLRRLEAAAALPLDGLTVDIESTEVPDAVERNTRLLELSHRLRAAVPAERPIGAITLTPVHVQVVNPDYWPGYPWAELADTYDLILPMAYWSIRTGEFRAGERYVGENIDRIRIATGDPSIPIHVIGGIADEVTDADLTGMLTAIEDRGVLGGSLYDWATARPQHWATLAPLRGFRAVRG